MISGNFTTQLKIPHLFEFGSFMIDIKRCIEYAVKLLAKCVNKELKKGIEFFKGFDKNNGCTSSQRLCVFIWENYSILLNIYIWRMELLD